ncbi:unnamed protein product, partial [Linum tenue]
IIFFYDEDTNISHVHNLQGATTLNDDLQFLRDLESQYQVAATNPFANPPSSSIHEALDAVDNFLSYTLDEVIGAFDSAWPEQSLALLSKLELHIPLPGLSMDHMLSMHTASETIKSCLGAIEQATKLKDTMLHKENARATTSTSLQGKVSQGKAMSSQVTTLEARKNACSSRITELEAELSRLRAEEAQEQTQSESLIQNFNVLMGEIRALADQEKTLTPMKEIAFPRAKADQEERENKAKLVKLRATFDEIKKILHP